MHSNPALRQTPPKTLQLPAFYNCWFLLVETVILCLVNSSAFQAQFKYPLTSPKLVSQNPPLCPPPPARLPATKKWLPPECATGFLATLHPARQTPDTKLPTTRTTSFLSSSQPATFFPVEAGEACSRLVFSGCQPPSDWMFL